MIKKLAIASIALSSLCGATSALAQDADAPPPPCSSDEHRQLDFWIGDWDVSWEGPEGEILEGRNTITLELGTCAIVENFDSTGTFNIMGRSISTYNEMFGGWKQVWVDSSGSYFPFSGGPDEEGFHFTLDRPNEELPQMRMIFRDITEDSLTWRWQRFDDEAGSWADQWVISYVRRP